MQHIHSLKNHFLIAMPHMQDSYFAGSVIYLCEYDNTGALGLVLNKPMQVGLDEICRQLRIRHTETVLPTIYSGGPVKPENGFILHHDNSRWRNTLEVEEGIHLTSSKDILEAIAVEGGPQYFRLALGYAGWEEGQLDQELIDNVWLTVPATPELLFHTEPQALYAACLGALGLSIESLGGDFGRA